jgi:hypothetical protein
LGKGLAASSSKRIAFDRDLDHPEAYEAIKATLPAGDVAQPPQTDRRGLISIWLDREFVDRLGQMRGPGESYSDVILRLARANS